jgi:hypothetical protein
LASSRLAAVRYSDAVRVGQQLAQISGSTIGATPNATDNRANVIRMIEAHAAKAMSKEFSRPCFATSGYKIVGENRVTSVSNRFYNETSSASGLESGKIADRKMIFRRKFADLPKIWAIRPMLAACKINMARRAKGHSERVDAAGVGLGREA